MSRYKFYWLTLPYWWKLNRFLNMLIWPYFLHTSGQVYLSNLGFSKSSSSSVIHVVQFQWNQVIYQGTRIGPYKGSGKVNHTFKLSIIYIFAKCTLLLIQNTRSHEERLLCLLPRLKAKVSSYALNFSWLIVFIVAVKNH